MDRRARRTREQARHDVVYGANLDLEPPASGQPRRQYGTAIPSRYPILASRNTLLPKGEPTEEQRGLLEATIDVHGVKVRAMTTHLQHDDAGSRLRQVEVVAARADSRCTPGPCRPPRPITVPC